MTPMKKIIINAATRLAAAAVLMFAATSCLFEEPERTADGELGVDPTETLLTADISLSLSIPAIEPGGGTFVIPATDGTLYRRRTVVAASADGFPTVSKTVYSDIAVGADKLELDLTLRLHARHYKLSVWSDYVRVQDDVVDGTYFYNIDQLPNVYMGTTYRGCDNYKDAACGYASLDLTPYKDKWGKRVALEMPLSRPVSRLCFVADDTRAFLDRIASGAVQGTSFTARVSYPGYLCMGYNVETSLPRHSLMYMKFEKSFKSADLAAGTPFTLAFDYLFATSDKAKEIPVKIEILDNAKENVLATSSFNALCLAGTETTVTYGFLTSEPGEGVGFNPDFSGSGTIVVPALPTEN